MLIAFLPFIAFVIIEHLVGTLAGLIAGALISITLLVQGRVRGGQVKVLEAGTALLITSVWAAAFALMVAADLILLYLPNVSTRAAVFITLGALYGAFKFTGWYPEHAAGQAKELA